MLGIGGAVTEQPKISPRTECKEDETKNLNKSASVQDTNTFGKLNSIKEESPEDLVD